MTAALTNILNEVNGLQAAGKALEALQKLDAYRTAYGASPALLQKMAELFYALDVPQGAEEVLQEGLRQFAGDVLLSHALANHYYRIDQCAEGLKLTTAFLQAENPPDEIILTHANLCKACGRLDEAEQLYEKILRKDARNIFALSNLAALYFDERRLDEAIHLFERAHQEAPANAAIAVKLAQAHFRAGNLAKGWQLYAARFHDGTVAARPFPQALWHGTPLEGKTLLLWGEQGIGEEILYSTMLPDAHAKAPALIVECDPRLQPLFMRSFPDVTFVGRHKTPDEKLLHSSIGAQCPMGNLGLFFRSNFDAFPKTEALLKSDAEKTAALRSRYDAIKKERGLTGQTIGFSWRSKPLRHGDPKSTKIEDWAPIFQNSPHLFINLQHGGLEDAMPFIQQQGWNFIDDKSINQQRSLDDLAAQISVLDSVITVSNTTAHMAGALGVKTAVLLPLSRGLMWHWFTENDACPWYASVRLFRQTRDGDWTDVLQRVAAACC